MDVDQLAKIALLERTGFRVDRNGLIRCGGCGAVCIWAVDIAAGGVGAIVCPQQLAEDCAPTKLQIGPFPN